MSNAETKTAPKAENKNDVTDLQPEVQELEAADAEQVRGGLTSSLSLNYSKIEISY